MNLSTERRLLQGAIVIACLVPISMGAASLVEGPAVLRGVVAPAPPDLDSHFRYLSGLFFAIGIGFLSCVPAIERRGPRFRLLGALVVAGGLGRLASLLATGAPGRDHLAGLALELGLLPLLMLWQARVAARARGGSGHQKGRRT